MASIGCESFTIPICKMIIKLVNDIKIRNIDSTIISFKLLNLWILTFLYMIRSFIVFLRIFSRQRVSIFRSA